MNNEFEIMQELTIGDKIRREEEILSLMETADPLGPGYAEMMSEIGEIMKAKFEFLKMYSAALKENE